MLELRLNNQVIASTEALPLPTAHVQEWQAVEFSCIPPAGDMLVLTLSGLLNSTKLAPFLRPGDPAWHWQWNPQNTTGQFTLTLHATSPDGHVETLQTALEIVPAKMDQERYAALLDDLQQLAHNLIYALAHSSVGSRLLFPPTESQDDQHQRNLLEEYCSFYEQRIATLERVVSLITRHPATTSRPRQQHARLEQSPDLSRIDSATLGRALSMQESEVLQHQTTSTADTYENRVLKHLLGECWRRVQIIAEVASQQPGNAQQRLSMSTIAERSHFLARRLHRLRFTSWLNAVGQLTHFQGPSQRMRHDPVYRQVYHCWQELRQLPALDLESTLFQLPIQELPRLYEYWCVLQVVQAALDLPDVVVQRQNLFAVARPSHSRNSLAPNFRLACTLTLTEETPLLELDWQGISIQVSYHPSYRPQKTSPLKHDTVNTNEEHTEQEQEHRFVSLDRHTHIPDLALAYTRPGQPPALLVFDAKYRLDAQGSIPADALADAYTYLGSIGLPSGEHATHAAVLLYPGLGSPEHYASGTGIFPLLPDSVAPFRTWLLQKLTTQEDKK